MKKLFLMLAVILTICGTSMLSSCSNDDEPVEPSDYTGIPLIILDVDIAWTDAHPIKQVYMTCNCNTGQMMWDPMAVIQAVEGDDLFSLSPRGTVTLTDKAETIFTPSAMGNCRYQLPGSADWNTTMLEKIRRYNKMM